MDIVMDQSMDDASILQHGPSISIPPDLSLPRFHSVTMADCSNWLDESELEHEWLSELDRIQLIPKICLNQLTTTSNT